MRCDGWRTVYCPNLAAVRIRYAYKGATHFPDEHVWCCECYVLAHNFFLTHVRTGVGLWQTKWLSVADVMSS